MDDPSQREIAEKQWYSYAMADSVENIPVQRSADILVTLFVELTNTSRKARDVGFKVQFIEF